MKQSLIVSLLLALLIASPSRAEVPRTFKIGYIGSLTGFASSYGTAVLEGVQVAVDELNSAGNKIELTVEDDASEMKNTVSAYKRLTGVTKVDALVTGTWWVHSIVKQTEKANLPLISAESLREKDSVLAKNFFLMQGYLKDWVDVYEPLFVERGFRRGATIRYASNFGATLAERMKERFSVPGRTYLGEVEYSDITVADAASVVLRLKELNPDVVYIDGQPGGFATLLKKIAELKLPITVLTNAVGRDALNQKLIDPSIFPDFYYSTRNSLSPSFIEAFQKKFGREPILNADLGYYGTHLLLTALKNSDPIAFIKSGAFKKDGITFKFSDENVFLGVTHKVSRAQK